MTADDIKQLADRLQFQAGIANFDDAFPELVHVAEEAALYLRLVAPYVPTLMPLLAGEIRRGVERRQLDHLRNEVDRLLQIIREFRHPSGPSLATEVEADRLIREGGRNA